jgi:hypothetical protein
VKTSLEKLLKTWCQNTDKASHSTYEHCNIAKFKSDCARKEISCLMNAKASSLPQEGDTLSSRYNHVRIDLD